MKLEVVIAVFTCDINATRLHHDNLIPSLLPSFLFLCHSLLFCCQQICPEWSWWGTRTPSWGRARCPSWDRRNRASWPSPAHLYSTSIWRRRKSLWSTTAWLWTSGTLWFIYFSRVYPYSGLSAVIHFRYEMSLCKPADLDSVIYSFPEEDSCFTAWFICSCRVYVRLPRSFIKWGWGVLAVLSPWMVLVKPFPQK